MAVPADKGTLLAAVGQIYETKMAEFQAVPRVPLGGACLAGHAKGTVISACDLVAYLLGWNSLFLKWLARPATPARMDFPETGYKWNALGALAQKFFADHQGGDHDDLSGDLNRAKTAIKYQVNIRGKVSLYGAAWYGKHTLGRIIQLNTVGPYKNATLRLRRWPKQDGFKS